MRHRAALPAQRTRRFLRQEALKRSHRRCDLIRLAPEDEPATSSPLSASAAEPAREADLTALQP